MDKVYTIKVNKPKNNSFSLNYYEGDLEGEIWKEYMFGYKVSNKGRIMNTKSYKKPVLLRPYKKSNGYLQVDFKADGKKFKKYVHRLVAECFIDNTYNYDTVDHIDGNKENNNVDNLQWCDLSTNLKNYFNKIICQLDINTNKVIREYTNCREAAIAIGKEQSYNSIISCAKHLPRYNTAFGYKWIFKDEYYG